MNNRLLEIIKYKTGGHQTEFASLLGWTPPYLTKLLKGDNFGITPVLTIVTKLPEINARWLLLGDGDMIEASKYTAIRKKMHENILAVLDIEKYMPVMSPDELRNYEQVIIGNKKSDFSPELLAKWQGLLIKRNEEIAAKFKVSADKSNRTCKQQKVKK